MNDVCLHFGSGKKIHRMITLHHVSITVMKAGKALSEGEIMQLNE